MEVLPFALPIVNSCPNTGTLSSSPPSLATKSPHGSSNESSISTDQHTSEIHSYARLKQQAPLNLASREQVTMSRSLPLATHNDASSRNCFVKFEYYILTHAYNNSLIQTVSSHAELLLNPQLQIKALWGLLYGIYRTVDLPMQNTIYIYSAKF